MTKVAIRRATAKNQWPRWHFVSFEGPNRRESRGVVDLIAVRKDYNAPPSGMKRGDALQIILIQVKGGSAAKPTPAEARRIRAVARHHGACGVLLATWKRGKEARFYALCGRSLVWREVDDLRSVFG